MKVSFCARISQTIPPKYKTEKSKENTVAVLGSSKATDDILDYMDMCSNTTKAMILNGKNIVHGCGTLGIMGAAYESGMIYSRTNKYGKPEQNLAIITEPLWGNEDLENCIPISCAKNEAERIEKFTQVANTLLVFPGSAGTLQEVTTLISKNYYGKAENKRKIILVGSDFFSGLIDQYEQLYESKLINCRPEELFTVVNSEKEILAQIE